MRCNIWISWMWSLQHRNRWRWHFFIYIIFLLCAKITKLFISPMIMFWSSKRAFLWLWWSCSCKNTCVYTWSAFIAETGHDSNTDEATLVLAEFVFHAFHLFSCRVFWLMPVSWTLIQVFYNRYRLPILICLFTFICRYSMLGSLTYSKALLFPLFQGWVWKYVQWIWQFQHAGPVQYVDILNILFIS